MRTLSELLTQAAAEIEAQIPAYADRADELDGLIEHVQLVAAVIRELETAANHPN